MKCDDGDFRYDFLFFFLLSRFEFERGETPTFSPLQQINPRFFLFFCKFLSRLEKKSFTFFEFFFLDSTSLVANSLTLTPKSFFFLILLFDVKVFERVEK
jgi:hypothetical protein